MRSLFVRWLINTLALYVAVQVVPGVDYDRGPIGLLLVAVLFGFVNAFLRPLLTLLTCPLVLVTLGLFLFVINGLMFWLAGSMLEGFHVGGFWSGVFGAVLYSIFSSVLSSLLPAGRDTR